MKKLTIAKLMMAAAAYRPPPLLSGSDWADRYRVLPSADSEPGPYRTDRFPLIREIQDTLCDEDTRQVVIWGPTQSAKTTAIGTFIGRSIHHDPGRTLIVYPTEEKAKEFATEKLEPMLQACPVLREKAALGYERTRRKQSILDKTFPGMTVSIRGGNSENPFSSGAMKNVILDEVDRIPRNKEGRPIDLARQRTTTFSNHKLILASTCTETENSEIEAEYAKSDQRRPYVPCLACGHMHVMGFFPPGTANHEPGTGWVDFDHAQDAEEARAKARYRCPACRHEHYDRDKPAMLARAEWRKGNPASAVAGFWWSALYSPWVSFGTVAFEFRESNQDDDAYRVWWNCRLSRTWKIKTDAPSASVLDACIDERPAGVVPDGAILITGGCDVQKHVVYWVVRAWGAGGRSWLIANGCMERESDSIAGLDDVFATTYSGQGVRQVLIDSGWDEEVVYDHCIGRRNCAPSKGMNTDSTFDIKSAEQTREKGQYRGRKFFLWYVNSHKLRAHIHDRIELPTDSPRAWRLHADVDREYRQHILARERIQVKRANRMVVEWNHPDRADHYMDAEIYAFAASKMPHIAPALVSPMRRPSPVSAAVDYESRRSPIRRSYG